MNERDGYPAGVPCWIDTERAHPDAALAFYGGLLGWEFAERTPSGAPERYLMARLRGRDVAGLGASPRAGAPGWNSYVAVERVEDALARAVDAGGTVLQGPIDIPGSGRMGVLADPEGAALRIWEARGHGGAQLVNELGTWNFSGLSTGDPRGAQAFYGAVFGWELSTEADSGFSFWRRPGYADVLERSDPGLRARLAELGATVGFEDAVALMTPTGGEGGGDAAPARWDVTFSVDDADAVAARAERLGGTVLVAPFDAPWVRMTVIADPEGAVFSASHFRPPT